MSFEPLKNVRYQNIFFFVLLMIIGITLLYPYHNFQLHLAQGDHGNNLYAFRKTLEGAKPYRDYWWVYGPLMPYYYSVFLHFFGINIHSVLIGYIFLHYLCGITLYFILRHFFPCYMALTATIFFWIFNTPFEHTYNHIGGIFAILKIMYFLLCYIKKQKKVFLYWALLWIFILSLIKLNFGLAMLFGFIVWLYTIGKIYKRPFLSEEKKVLATAVFVVPLCMVGVYWFFIKGLPIYAIRQCLLFVDTDPNHSSIWNSLKIFFEYYLFQLYWQNLLSFGILFLISFAYFIFLWKKNKLEESLKRRLKGMFLTIFLFIVFNLHEFMVSGITYRMFWIEPLRIIMIFIIIFTTLQYCPKAVRILACAFIVWTVVNNHIIRYQFFQPFKQYIPLERGKIYITNGYPWLKTVMQTTSFLKKNLKNNETFLAIPSDQLYYFLTDKNSPTRQSEFGLPIAIEQEEEEIQALEAKKIKLILLSNRFRTPETGMGMFGETYGRRLGGYIKAYYRPYAVFGDWDKDPEWFSNHGVLIFKRIEN